MSIVNRRNAVLGWGVWKVSKIAAKQKAKQAVKTNGSGSRSKRAIVPAVAAAGGALWFWRRRRSDESPKD